MITRLGQAGVSHDGATRVDVCDSAHRAHARRAEFPPLCRDSRVIDGRARLLPPEGHVSIMHGSRAT